MESSIGGVSDDSIYENQPLVNSEIERPVVHSGTSHGEEFIYASCTISLGKSRVELSHRSHYYGIIGKKRSTLQARGHPMAS